MSGSVPSAGGPFGSSLALLETARLRSTFAGKLASDPPAESTSPHPADAAIPILRLVVGADINHGNYLVYGAVNPYSEESGSGRQDSGDDSGQSRLFLRSMLWVLPFPSSVIPLKLFPGHPGAAKEPEN
jgi:hypothetical protein